jgi:hypothetical protein
MQAGSFGKGQRGKKRGKIFGIVAFQLVHRNFNSLTVRDKKDFP